MVHKTKYKKGDIVKVRTDLEDDSSYGCNVYFASQIRYLRGKVFKVEKFKKEENHIFVSKDEWVFSDDMLIPIEIAKKDIKRYGIVDFLEKYATKK